MVINTKPTSEEESGSRVSTRPEKAKVTRNLSDHLLVSNFTKSSSENGITTSQGNNRYYPSLTRSASDTYFHGHPLTCVVEQCNYVKPLLPIRTYNDQKLIDGLDSKDGTNIKNNYVEQIIVIDALKNKKKRKADINYRERCYVVASQRQEENFSKKSRKKGHDRETHDLHYKSKNKNPKTKKWQKREYHPETDNSNTDNTNTDNTITEDNTVTDNTDICQVDMGPCTGQRSGRVTKKDCKVAWTAVKEMYRTPCSSVVSVQQILVKERKYGPYSILTSTTGLVGGNICACCIPPPCSCPRECPTCGQEVERCFVTPTPSEMQRKCRAKCPVCRLCPAGNTTCQARECSKFGGAYGPSCGIHIGHGSPTETVEKVTQYSQEAMHASCSCAIKNCETEMINEEIHCHRSQSYINNRCSTTISQNRLKTTRVNQGVQVDNPELNSAKMKKSSRTSTHQVSRTFVPHISRTYAPQSSRTSSPSPLSAASPPHKGSLNKESSDGKTVTATATRTGEGTETTTGIRTTTETGTTTEPTSTGSGSVRKKKSNANVQCALCCTHMTHNLCNDFYNISKAKYEKDLLENANKLAMDKRIENTDRQMQKNLKYGDNVMNDLIYNQYDLHKGYPNNPLIYPVKRLSHSGHRGNQKQMHLQVTNEAGELISMEVVLPENSRKPNRYYTDNAQASTKKVKKIIEDPPKSETIVKESSEEANTELESDISLKVSSSTFFEKSKSGSTSNENEKDSQDRTNTTEEESTFDEPLEKFVKEDKRKHRKWVECTSFEKSKIKNDKKRESSSKDNTPRIFMSPKSNQPITLNVPLIPKFPSHSKLPRPLSIHDIFDKRQVSKSFNSSINSYEDKCPKNVAQVLYMNNKDIAKRNISKDMKATEIQTLDDGRTFSGLFANILNSKKHNVKNLNEDYMKARSARRENFPSYIYYKNPLRDSGESESESCHREKKSRRHCESTKIKPTDSINEDCSEVFQKLINLENISAVGVKSVDDNCNAVNSDSLKSPSDQTVLDNVNLHEKDKEHAMSKCTNIVVNIAENKTFEIRNGNEKAAEDKLVAAGINIDGSLGILDVCAKSAESVKCSMGDVHNQCSRPMVNQGTNPRMIVHSEAPGVCVIRIAEDSVKSLDNLIAMKKTYSSKKCGAEEKLVSNGDVYTSCIMYGEHKLPTQKHENTQTKSQVNIKGSEEIFFKKYISFKDEEYISKTSNTSGTASVATEVVPEELDDVPKRLQDNSYQSIGDSNSLIKSSDGNSSNSILSTININNQTSCIENDFLQDVDHQGENELKVQSLKYNNDILCPIPQVCSKFPTRNKPYEPSFSHGMLNSPKIASLNFPKIASAGCNANKNPFSFHQNDLNISKEKSSEIKKPYVISTKFTAASIVPEIQIPYPCETLCFKTWEAVRREEPLHKSCICPDINEVNVTPKPSVIRRDSFSKCYTETLFKRRRKTSKINQKVDCIQLSYKSPGHKTLVNYTNKPIKTGVEKSVEYIAGPVLFEKQLGRLKPSTFDRNLPGAVPYCVVDRDMLAVKRPGVGATDIETEKVKKHRDNNCTYYVGCVMINNNKKSYSSSEASQSGNTLVEKTGDDLNKAKIKANAIMKASAEMKKLNFKNNRQTKENVSCKFKKEFLGMSNSFLATDKFFKKEIFMPIAKSVESDSTYDPVSMDSKEDQTLDEASANDIIDKVNYETQSMCEIFDDLNNLIQQCTSAEHNIITTFRNRTIELPRFVKRHSNQKRSFPILNGRVGSNNKVFKNVKSNFEKEE